LPELPLAFPAITTLDLAGLSPLPEPYLTLLEPLPLSSLDVSNIWNWKGAVCPGAECKTPATSQQQTLAASHLDGSNLHNYRAACAAGGDASAAGSNATGLEGLHIEGLEPQHLALLPYTSPAAASAGAGAPPARSTGFLQSKVPLPPVAGATLGFLDTAGNVTGVTGLEEGPGSSSAQQQQQQPQQAAVAPLQQQQLQQSQQQAAVERLEQQQLQQAAVATLDQPLAVGTACLTGLTKLVANNTSFPMLALAQSFKGPSANTGSSIRQAWSPAAAATAVPHTSVTHRHSATSPGSSGSDTPGRFNAHHGSYGRRHRISRGRGRLPGTPHHFADNSNLEGLPKGWQGGAGVLKCKGLRHLELQGIVTEPWRCQQHGSSCNCMVGVGGTGRGARLEC
jgi:hypothetical protein